MSLNSTRSPRKYGERNKTSHGGSERHPYAHRRERRRAPGGAVSRFSRIMVFVAPSVACARRSWIPCDRARYARLRADGSPSTNRSVHAAPTIAATSGLAQGDSGPENVDGKRWV